MSVNLPEVLDAKRMIAARRIFEGTLALESMGRLQAFVDGTLGDCRYHLAFDTDPLGIAFLEIKASAELPLSCQRTLASFTLPVEIVQRLGLINDESEEAGLPEEFEPLLLGPDGMINPLDLIEDELILAVPLIPVAPGTEAVVVEVPPDADEIAAVHPFAALSALKQDKQ